MHDSGTERRALDAVARVRSHGLHFHGQFLGVRAAGREVGRVRLSIEPESPDASGHRLSPVAMATVADLAMASAIRAELGVPTRLATATLALHHLAEPEQGPVTAAADALRTGGPLNGGFASCQLRDARDSLVAVADGWFVAGPAPGGAAMSPIPWESGTDAPVPELHRSDLSDVEEQAVAAAEAAAARADGGEALLSEEMLHLSFAVDDGHGLTATMRLGPEHSNRVGHAQGGVLYGAAARVAVRLLGAGSGLLEGHLQLVRPASGPVLSCSATVRRRGRRVVACEVRLCTDDEVVAVGQFTGSACP